MSATFTATVEDAQTAPVTGATLTLTPADTGDPVPLEELVAGQYVARALAGGSYDLTLTGPGLLTDTYRVELTPGQNSGRYVMGRPGERFFFADGLKVYFEPVNDRVLLAVSGTDAVRKLGDAAAERSMDLSVGQRSAEAGDAVLATLAVPPADEPFSTDAGAVREALEAQDLSVVPAVVVQRGAAPPQGLTQELLVQFAPDVDEEEADAIAAAAGLEIRRRVLSTPNAYLLHDPRGPRYGLLDVAEELAESAPVVTAEPALLMQLELDQYTPNDPLYALQDHLPLIDCDHAWEAAADFLGAALRGGSPEICVAVFDPDGVTPNHPDLTTTLTGGVAKLVTSFNFATMTTQTVPGLGGDHGTQSAGTATAAFDDNRGTAGVAPNCRVIGARLPAIVTDVAMADAFLWAAGIDNGSTTPGFPALPAQPADVISNSWGASNVALSTALRSAFDRLTDEGRGGHGCVVTFSTGNLGYTQFSNVRRFAAYDRNLAVGASINANPTSPVDSSQPDPNGNTTNLAAVVDRRAFYNPFGPEMDIVAPSHTCYAPAGDLVDPTTSTVRVGNGALDGCPGAPTCLDYATSFGGTSHASPTIAGAAALILSIFPVLGWDEARAVLRRTAVRIDAGQTNAVGRYVDNDGDGVAEFSQWYGYGRVDVAQAVRETARLAVATYQAWS